MGWNSWFPLRPLPCRAWLGVFVIGFCLVGRTFGQTASTGAVAGVTLDPSGAVLPGVVVHLAKDGGGERKSVTSDENGRFGFLLLEPGKYELQASRLDFEPVSLAEINIHVTETLRLELHLRLATHVERAQVSSNQLNVQLDSSALGRVVNQSAVSGLPLVTRNFSQIASLSPGVSTGVYNAGELGLGGTALSQIAKSNDGIYVHGARSYDNNFQLDGISVSDVQGSAAGSGGIPIPNPDSIQEFKVQTGLYDAAYGRYGGANITLITRTASDDFHGSVFEFLCNEILNANDFFLNRTGQRRPVLKQNQFGFALGGPIKKDRLLFFGSFQGTRQTNGIAAGQSRTACTASLIEPPFTNDRTTSELGKLFALDTDGADINSTSSGNALTLGDQNSPRQRWGVRVSTALIGSFSAPRGCSQAHVEEHHEPSWAIGL